MVSSQKPLIDQLRKLLDELVRARKLDNEIREEVAETVVKEARALISQDGLLEALDAAIGRSKRRREEAVIVLAEWSDRQDVLDKVGEWLKDRDPGWRFSLVQLIGHKRLTQFGGSLSELIATETDELSRDTAIHAAGMLKAKECVPVLLRLAQESNEGRIKNNACNIAWRLAESMSRFGVEEFRRPLAKWFEDTSLETSNRIFSAIGLAKLDDERAITFLIAMLDDPDEGWRAVQGLCEVFDLPFVWRDKSCVEEARKRAEELVRQLELRGS